MKKYHNKRSGLFARKARFNFSLQSSSCKDMEQRM